MAKPTDLESLDMEEKWLNIHGFTNATAAHFVTKSHTVNFS